MNTSNTGARRTHHDQSGPDAPAGLCCPRCKVHLIWEADGGRCSECGRTAVVRGERLTDFLGAGATRGEEILGWPADFVDLAVSWLPALRSREAVPPAAAAALEARGLAGPHRHLTGLGSKLAYHAEEYRLQVRGDGIGDATLDRMGLTRGARVLDIGCGAGQTLRLLAPRLPAERVGVDFDVESLAFGCRIAAVEGQEIDFVRATAHDLPFDDGRFSHVTCRVSLNYMHQDRALAEMVRVLQPGGHLYLRVEGPGHDVRLMARARGARRLLSCLRDFILGLTLEVAGRQPMPGSLLAGGRTFGTPRRLVRFLGRSGCKVIRAQVTMRYIGLARRLEIVSSKSS